ncbi:MAG: hypothetical protein RJA99_4252 [Pseudomonadota bacterium]|jgi:hypothetical protein
MTSFARRQIAHTASDGTWTFLPGRPHQWTGDELVGVISRDDRRHAYLLHDGEQEAFYAWARTCGGWENADGEFDGEMHVEAADDWTA